MKRIAIALLTVTVAGTSSTHASPAGSPALVINEIDYDQPSTDTGEFIEIKNNETSAVDLSSYAVLLVNGNAGGAVVYDTILLPAVSLAPGDYFVICANGGTVANCDLDVTPDTDLIQNGAPDAVALVLASDGSVLDTVSYEGDTGAPYTEGTGTSATDNNTTPFIGVSRFPDGVDTNNNDADWSRRCISPGAANVISATGCQAIAVQPVVWSNLKSLYR